MGEPDELDLQLRPAQDQLAVLAPRDARRTCGSSAPNAGRCCSTASSRTTCNVCTNCDHHMAITPARAVPRAVRRRHLHRGRRCPKPVADPLHFSDQKRYPDRMKAAQKATGEREAMLVAEGEIGRTPIVAAAQDFAFMGGSMGMYVGNAIIAAAERAVAMKRPLVLFSAAGGARMQEGILQPDADAAHHRGGRDAEGGGAALHRRADPPDHRRRHRLLRDAGRRADRRAERADLLRRPAGDRADDPREAARGLPAGRIPARPRHARPGDPPQEAEGRAGARSCGCSPARPRR